jgi:hypothetical protein
VSTGPRHALRNLNVILDLALIVSEEAGRDVPQGGEAALLDQRSEHERLIQMRHAHLLREEIFELLKNG